MTNTRRLMAACAVLFALTSPAAAQQAEPANAASAPVTMMTRPAPVPTLTLTLQEVNVAEQNVSAPLALPAQQSRGSSVALMVVGGAAMVLGAVIGGDEGTIMMVGGAGVGLWGLYTYMR